MKAKKAQLQKEINGGILVFLVAIVFAILYYVFKLDAELNKYQELGKEPTFSMWAPILAALVFAFLAGSLSKGAKEELDKLEEKEREELKKESEKILHLKKE